MDLKVVMAVTVILYHLQEQVRPPPLTKHTKIQNNLHRLSGASINMAILHQSASIYAVREHLCDKIKLTIFPVYFLGLRNYESQLRKTGN